MKVCEKVNKMDIIAIFVKCSIADCGEKCVVWKDVMLECYG